MISEDNKVDTEIVDTGEQSETQSNMTSVDLGLFGLDCFVGDKTSSMEQDLDMYTSSEFESLLAESSGQNILDMSLQSSGITETGQDNNQPSWDDDTDDFLKAMLTGSDLNTEISGIGSETVCPSDTSSDSGCPEDRVRTLTSPGLDDGPRYSPCLDYSPLPNSPHSTNSVDLVEYLSNDSDSGEAVSPLTLITDPEIQTATGTTTIILPVVQNHQQQHTPYNHASAVSVTPLRLAPRDPGPAAKRRRVSASSSDSGVEDTNFRHQTDNKYPPLELNDEEQKMATKENMKFPSHYPLTREEERNLKKIRRKIRNKLSAQDSRKRKREYMDNMEDRVKVCTDENQELKDKIKALESQNKTLAAQLRRLHQIVVNGGLRQGQTSTALMVLLLSTALFLIPGFRDQAESKSEIDIQAAVKMPPMPGQSRSLLQFDGLDRSNNDIADLKDFQETIESEGEKTMMIKLEKGGAEPPYSDHDYTYTYKYTDGVKAESGSAWIEEDAPPMGYGPAVKAEDEDRHMNVNVSSSGQGTKTVILQIPKDIK